MNTSNGRHLRLRRAVPVMVLAAIAFLLGAIAGSGSGDSAGQSLSEQFARAWTEGDYASMYADVAPADRGRISASRFEASYKQAARTATELNLRTIGRAHAEHGMFAVPMRVQTRLWGTLRETLRLRVGQTPEGARVLWTHSLVFPGLAAGELLSANTTLPPRAALLARDGAVLAEGQSTGAGVRESVLGAAAAAVVGEVGPVPKERVQELEALGVPAQAIVGTSGLELALDMRLRGKPGGELLAGKRVMASVAATPSPPVRTSISPGLQRVASSALGSQLGGVVAMDPKNGEILAVAGIGIDDLQPPGSTFKMVTLSAALEAKAASLKSVFAYATYATLDGVKLENANGESCGGSLALAFAVSCNSVFAPLGVRVGAGRLVRTAEDFGFNHPPGVEGALESTLPSAGQIQGELDLGSTAIGQGEVQASALEMAVVASTIADGGRRPLPTFHARTSANNTVRAIKASTARIVRRLMIGVVREGTGTSAAIPGVVVAGKTGTAELGTPSCSHSSENGGEAGSAGEESEGGQGEESCTGSKDPQNTDAWFAAFAPALHPKIAVGVLLVKDGAGGETAAPLARQVIEAGLR